MFTRSMRHSCTTAAALVAALLSYGCLDQDESAVGDSSSELRRLSSKTNSPTRSGRNALHVDSKGRISTPRGVFDSVSDWFGTNPFSRDYERCSTKSHTRSAQRNLRLSGGYRASPAPSDCTLGTTNIEIGYELTDTKLVVPVVFHVLQREDGIGFISSEQLLSQIEILNEDFGAKEGTNGNGGPKSEDVHIQFVLAGIDRHRNDTWFDDPEAYEQSFKAALNWDVDNYLNIYTVSPNDGGLGWAYLPQDMAGVANYDGVVLDYTTVGRDAPGAPYNQGRTATHEVGHYLGLRHTFYPNEGDVSGICENGWSSGDLIQSTPAQPAATFGCPPVEQLCSGGVNAIAANVHNYMNYTEDTCMFYFDIQQSNRSVCGLMNYRPELYITVPNDSVVRSFVQKKAGNYIVGVISNPNVLIAGGSHVRFGAMATVPSNKAAPAANVRARLGRRVGAGPTMNVAEDTSSGLNPAFIDYTMPSDSFISYSVSRAGGGTPPSHSGFIIYQPN